MQLATKNASCHTDPGRPYADWKVALRIDEADTPGKAGNSSSGFGLPGSLGY